MPEVSQPALSSSGVKPDIQNLSIQYRSINELKSDPKNPRNHSDKQVRQIARSIESFGFNVPILVDGNFRVIAGHGRLQACRLLGLEVVPTISLEHLSDAQTRAFMIADNRLTENATWNDKLLGEQLKVLSEVDLTFDLEVTGFEMAEIDLLIEGLSPAAEGAADPADEIPELQGKAQVTCEGDLWLLDRHRVCCGSALKPESYAVLMNGKSADCVFTDPPYNVPIAGHASGLGRAKHADFVMASGEMNEAEFTEFLMQACQLAAQHSREGSLHFVCMDWRHIKELLAAGEQAYTELKNLCVWAKDNAGMGSLYRSQHEFVFVFKYGKAPHRNNVQLGQYGRYRSNVWRYPGLNSFSRPGDEGNLLALHPTVKPVALVADAILDCTARGDLVLDPFLGSGTTVIAGERTGRVCYGLELDPMYVDTVIRRWQQFTGKQAVHAQSGRNFNDVELEVENAFKN
jgi:DNA modification methylase